MLESRSKATTPISNTPAAYGRNTSNGSINSNTSPRRSRISKLNAKTASTAIKMKKCNRRKCETGIFGALAIFLLWLNTHFIYQYPGYHHNHQSQNHQLNSEPQATPQHVRRGIIENRNTRNDHQKEEERQQPQADKAETPSSAAPGAKRTAAAGTTVGTASRARKSLANHLFRKPSHVRHQRPKPKLMDFDWRRSKYAPPEDYIEHSPREEPNDYWMRLLDGVDAGNIPSSLPRNQRTLNLTRSTPYLGVLIDGGRHYFELDWLYRLMDLLHLLQYNMVHFRLTDDQTFNIQLKSWPQLAVPTPFHNEIKVYQPEDLRKLVKYAKERNITVIPEINIPGHAGAWAGVPGLVVPCPNFICQKGYGLPLNVNHPQLPQILKDVLSEVLEIFDQPPYLHLGGDEIEMSKPCFQEIKQPLPNYTVFEETLKRILKEDLDYNESKVIRWEMTLGGADPKGKSRAGQILQWWFQIPGEKHAVQTRPNDPFIASSGLYMDANEDDGAWEVFLHARKWLHLNFDYKPQAIVVGTFELDQEFWFDRNVVGKLLATAMGVSNEVQAANGTELYEVYKRYCSNHLHFPDSVCNKYAKPNLPTTLWKEPKWRNVMWKELREGLCDRLTMSKSEAKGLPPPSGGTAMDRQFRPQFMFNNQTSEKR